MPRNAWLGTATSTSRVARKASEAGAVPPASDVQSLTGRGLRATVEGQMVRAGNRRLFDEEKLELPDPLAGTLAQLEDAGRTAVLVHTGARF